MITCSECDTKYEPITDACKCPCCGESNYQEDQEDDAQPPAVGVTCGTCNVCGIKLRTFDEEQMGLCDSCAWDWQPTQKECEGL